MKKVLILLLVLFCTLTKALADIDWNEFGSFSDRSTIMRTLEGRQTMTQEQKDILKAKKLAPTAECMIKQIKKNNLENVKLLLEAKTNPNESYYLEYPIYTAAKTNNLEAMKLLYSYGAKLDKGFNSELYEAVNNKNQEMTDFLLEKKARIDYIDSVTQRSILYCAIKNNMLETARTLFERGVSIDRKTAVLIRKKRLGYLFETR